LAKRRPVQAFKAILQATLEDVITREWSVSVDGIYKGRVVDEDDRNLYVKIGNETVGFLPKNAIPVEKREEILVQVERKHIGRKTPVLTTQLKIVGDCAILAPNIRGGVSLKIRGCHKAGGTLRFGEETGARRLGHNMAGAGSPQA